MDMQIPAATSQTELSQFHHCTNLPSHVFASKSLYNVKFCLVNSSCSASSDVQVFGWTVDVSLVRRHSFVFGGRFTMAERRISRFVSLLAKGAWNCLCLFVKKRFLFLFFTVAFLGLVTMQKWFDFTLTTRLMDLFNRGNCKSDTAN